MMVWYSAPPASSPAPRLRARSMLSLGTEVFFAFWMASYSVGLPPGSPPPVRAATSMFLISRANSLPRRASLTAFWGFVVAHLEWPLIVNRSRPISLLFVYRPDDSTWTIGAGSLTTPRAGVCTDAAQDALWPPTAHTRCFAACDLGEPEERESAERTRGRDEVDRGTASAARTARPPARRPGRAGFAPDPAQHPG